MGTLHEFRGQRKQPEQFEIEQDLARMLRARVDGTVGADATFEQREAAALKLTNEATRHFLEEELVSIADSHGEQVEVSGIIYQRHDPGTVRYYTLCGSVDIERCTYRQVGVHNGPTIVPMELEAGLVERATPALGYRVALGYSKDHMRSCEEDMKADHRRPPSRSTLERMAKEIGSRSKDAVPRIEWRVRNAESVPVGAVAISLGLDRTAVPMEEAVQPGEEPATHKTKRKEPYQRRKPEPVKVNYRMAYVGTISFHDCCGKELATRCYAAGAHESPGVIVKRLVADLRHALRQVPKLAVGIVQDGAPELWNLLPPAVASEPLVTKLHKAIDRYHLNDRLAELLRLVESNAAQRVVQLSRWNDSLDQNDNAIYRIRQWARDISLNVVAESNQELLDQVDPHLTYLENNANLMRYASLVEVGLPVGSGVTEGACKSVIKMRTNGSGQRWRTEGIAAVLTLRSIHKSERLPRFWAHFSRTYRQPVRACA